jgi:hypothetical protein
MILFNKNLHSSKTVYLIKSLKIIKKVPIKCFNKSKNRKKESMKYNNIMDNSLISLKRPWKIFNKNLKLQDKSVFNIKKIKVK